MEEILGRPNRGDWMKKGEGKFPVAFAIILDKNMFLSASATMICHCFNRVKCGVQAAG